MTKKKIIAILIAIILVIALIYLGNSLSRHPINTQDISINSDTLKFDFDSIKVISYWGNFSAEEIGYLQGLGDIYTDTTIYLLNIIPCLSNQDYSKASFILFVEIGDLEFSKEVLLSSDKDICKIYAFDTGRKSKSKYKITIKEIGK